MDRTELADVPADQVVEQLEDRGRQDVHAEEAEVVPRPKPRDVEPQLGQGRVRLLDDLLDDVDLGMLGQAPAGQGPVLMDQMLAGGLDGGNRAVLGRRQLDQLAGTTPRLRGDVEMVPQQEQERLGPDERRAHQTACP